MTEVYMPFRLGQMIKSAVLCGIALSGANLVPIVSDGGAKRENVYNNLRTILSIAKAPFVIMDSDIVVNKDTISNLVGSLNICDLSFVWSRQSYGHGVMAIGHGSLAFIKQMHIDVSECARCQWIKELASNGYKVYQMPGICEEVG